MDLSFVITCLFLFVVRIMRTQTGSVVITSKTSWLVGSNVTLQWIYTNGPGQTLKTIRFGLKAPGPPQSQNQEFITVHGGSEFKIVESNPWPANWTWYQGRLSWVGDLASKKAAFKLTKAALNDSRTFYCFVTWSGNYDSIEVTTKILITVPPTVIKPNVSSYYIQGNKVNVTCNTTGVPKPDVQWIRVSDSYKYQNFSGASYLRFDPVDYEDAGKYKCVASNSVGSDEKTVDIVVYYKPDIIVDQSNGTVGSWNGNKLTLQCVAKGNPPAKFQWYKSDGQQIASNVFTIKGSSRVTVETSDPWDYGKYKCRANNTAGFDEHNITVIQWVEPGEPKITVTDDDIGVSYIKLRWNPPSNNGGSQVIDYKVTVDDGNQLQTLPPLTGKKKLIDKLKPKWSYTIVLSARNIAGYSKSVSRTFKTKFEGPPGVSTLRNNETEISSEQFTLIWSAARENGAKILTYTVWWRQVDSTGGFRDWSSHNTSSDALSFIVTWLEFGTTYDFGVTAWNMFGQGPRDDNKGLKRIKVLEGSTETTSLAKEPDGSTGVNAGVIGGAAAAAAVIIIILVVIIVIVIIKRKKSPRKAGESRDPLGSNGDEGYSSVSKASAARRLGRNNTANDDAGIPTYATVDKSKKTPKKPDLIYAELADFNETPEARAASMKRQNQPISYVPTDYAEITQFGRPKEEPMYDNVPRY